MDRYIPKREHDNDLAHYMLVNSNTSEAMEMAGHDSRQTVVNRSMNNRPSHVACSKRSRSVVDLDMVLEAPGVTCDFYANHCSWSDATGTALALNNEVVVWDRADNRKDTTRHIEFGRPEGEYVTGVSHSPDGCLLAVGWTDGRVVVCKGTDVRFTIYSRTRSKGRRVAAFAWGKANVLSVGYYGGAIVNYKIRSTRADMTSRQPKSPHKQPICTLKWNSSHSLLACGCNDNTVSVWNANWELMHVLKTHLAAIKAISWHPSISSRIVTGGGLADGKLCLWKATTGEMIHQTHTHSQITGLVWKQGHRELLSSHGHGHDDMAYSVVVWCMPSMTKLQQFFLTGRALTMSIYNRGNSVMVVCEDDVAMCYQWEGELKPKKNHIKAYIR